MLFALLQSGQQFRAQAELDARRDVQTVARELRARLAAPAVLEEVPAQRRFALRDGRLVVPPEVGWLEPSPPSPPDPIAELKVRQAERAEHVLEDAAAAAAHWDELLGERGPQGLARLPVLARAAWQARRAGMGERVAALLRELGAALGVGPDAADGAGVPARAARAEVAGAAASAVVLHALRGEPVPEALLRLLAAAPAAVVGPAAQRLADVGADPALRERLAGSAQDLQHRRAFLREVAAALPGAPPGASAARLDGAPGVLLVFAHEDAGALLPAAELAARIADARAEVAAAPAPGRDGEPLVPGALAVEPRPLPAPGLLARPGAAIAAVLALALVFFGSAWLGVRALRREAQAVRARADFLTVVTHELKTPLASIRLIAEMLVERRVPAGQQADYYALLAGEAARLSMLIENVLDLGRTERGERAYDLRECDLAQLVREAAAVFAPLAAQAGLELRTDVAGEPALARADRGVLLQALLNVLDNARKYGASGGIVEVTAARRGDTFAILVRDHGAGIAAGEREAIFERFRRGDAHRHGAIPGVGLGLHLARAIARRHGGELRCAAPGDGGPGAVFEFSLPLAHDAQEVA